MKKSVYKIIVCLLIIMTVWMSVAAVSAKTVTDITVSEKAAVLRLNKYTGSVSIKNASDNAVRIKKDTKLFNGYTIKTEEKSYAWITLDKKGIIKLGECTSATVRKDGKKLEILLNEGEMFFNVNKKLSGTESLDIKTSNMTTGIRGTMGYVAASIEKKYEYNAEKGMTVKTLSKTTEVTILEGKVEVTAIDSASGGKADESVKTVQLSQANTCVIAENFDKEGSKASNGVLFGMNMGERDITELVSEKGFIAAEVADDEDIQQRLIKADIGFTEEKIEEVVNNSGAILGRNEKEKQEEREAAEQELSAQTVTQKLIVIEETQTVEDKQYAFGTKTDGSVPIVISNNNPKKISTDEPTITPQKINAYTVTFKDQNSNNFGYQQVISGQYASRPSIQPTKNGFWSIDGTERFSFTTTKITRNITLKWVSE